jgi:hypothetical protein
MAALVGTTRLDCSDDRTFIKGFSAMLVPTWRERDVVYWHVYCTNDDDRISYTHYVPRHAGQKSSFQMESSRHILGWSIEAEFYAGRSGLDTCRKGFANMTIGSLHASYGI